MATFSVCTSSQPDGCYYLFTIENNTNSVVFYSFESVLENIYSIWISGNQFGIIPPNSNTVVNFNIPASSNIQVGSAPIITVAGQPIPVRFWSGFSVDEQYINLIPPSNYTITQDTELSNAIQDSTYSIVVDGGGYDADTLHIYIHINNVSA